VQSVLAQGESWREQELQRARRALARGAPVDEVLQLLSATLTRKLLHGALAGLHHSKGEEHAVWADAAQRCFLRSDAHGAG
jgi:glutamyl-tRNA reductase